LDIVQYEVKCGPGNPVNYRAASSTSRFRSLRPRGGPAGREVSMSDLAYHRRFVWCIYRSQTTVFRFRRNSIFGFSALTNRVQGAEHQVDGQLPPARQERKAIYSGNR
jgi:hypothetical protein